MVLPLRRYVGALLAAVLTVVLAVVLSGCALAGFPSRPASLGSAGSAGQQLRHALATTRAAHDVTYVGEGPIPFGRTIRMMRFRMLMAGGDCAIHTWSSEGTVDTRFIHGVPFIRYDAAMIRTLVPGPRGRRYAEVEAGRWLRESARTSRTCGGIQLVEQRRLGSAVVEDEHARVGSRRARELALFARDSTYVWIAKEGPDLVLQEKGYTKEGPYSFRLLSHDTGAVVRKPAHALDVNGDRPV